MEEPHGPWVTTVDWTDIGKQVLNSIYAFLGIAFLSLPFKAWFHSRDAEGFRVWARRVVGTQTQRPKQRGVLEVFFALQFFASAATIAFWVHKTYIQEVPDWMVLAEYFPCAAVIGHFMINMVKHQFSKEYVFSLDTVMDTLTITPLLYQGSHRKWLSFSFLRSYRVIMSYLRCEATGVMDRLGEVLRGYIIAFVKFAMFLFTLAAVTFMLEVLGDFSWLEDSFTETAMGDISMYQMCYWMMTTISTVGYGDFAPSTMPSRLWILLVIPAGVVFFTVITGDLIEIRQRAVSGRGAYYPKKGTPHVVVCGGAVSSDSSVTLNAFLGEILHPQRGAARPEVVLMAPNNPKEWVCTKMMDRRYKGKLRYIRGHPIDCKDASRAQLHSAEMVFVLGDIFAATADLEDETNASIAAVLVNKNPSLKLRLMLLRPENRELAVNLGVRLMHCFALNEIKAMFLSQMCVSPGFTPIVLNLLKGDIVGMDKMWSPTETSRSGEKKSADPRWLEEYTLGTTFELYGCQLAERFVGKPFQEVVALVYQEAEAWALCLQAQDTGDVMVSPMGPEWIYDREQVVFVAARELDDVDKIRLEGTNMNSWKKEFRLVRDNATPKAIQAKRDSITLGSEENRPPVPAAAKTPSPSPAPGNPRKVGGPPMMKTNTLKMPWAPGPPGRGEPANMSSDSEKMMRQLDKVGQVGQASSRSSLLKSSEPMMKVVEGVNCSSVDVLEEICLVGDHIVLILQDETLWQQFIAVMQLLRAPTLSQHPSIIVITRASNRPPAQLADALQDVVYMQGDPQKLSTLCRANVAEARSVVLMAGRPSSRSEELDMDRDTLLVASLVERIQETANSPGQVVLDLHDIFNVTQLRGTVPPAWSTYNQTAKILKMMTHNKVHPEGEEGGVDLAGLQTKSIRDLTKGRSWLDTGMHEDVTELDAVFLHPRFATGNIVSRADLVRFFGYAFYTPGCLEVAEALMDPDKRGQSMRCSLVPVPRHLVGCTVAKALLDLLRYRAVLIGVFRAFSPLQDNKLPYAVGFPYKEMVLKEDDKIYVLAEEHMPLLGAQDPMPHDLLTPARSHQTTTIPEQDGDSDGASTPQAQ